MTDHTAPLNNIVHLKVGKCPICSKGRAQRYRPFCSKRCADVDLGRWFNEDYHISAEEDDKLDDQSFIDD